jgi:riboflavin kinase/FMN adenylyltransferase
MDNVLKNMEWITGTVIKGLQNGRKLNYPTANLQLDSSVNIESGTYAAEALLHNRHLYGMLYVGIRPTLHLTQKVVELHIFDFQESIYDATLQFRIIKKIREEKQFENMEQLALQIAEDKRAVQQLIQNRK